MTKQEALQMLPRLAQHADCSRSRPYQIAHRLVRAIGDPERRQLAGPMQFCQHRRIAAIRLHPVARFDRDQRWRHHHAFVPRPVSNRCSP